MKNIPTNIFREYDIRGLADKELSSEVARGIGASFATLLSREGKTKIGVGYDLRPSSDRLQKALIDGLTSAGAQVVNLGMIPTPVLYFSVSHLKLDGGICITGSHNPPEYNGFKFHLADRPFFGREIQTLMTMIQKEDFVRGKGQRESAEIIEAYIDYVKAIFNFKRKLKVVVDAGHGMACVAAPQLMKALGHEVIELYTNLNSGFPDHHPDPSVPENLVDLQKKVLETKADVGLAFDGDADRVGVVDEKGQIIPGDKILLLYAREILSRKPGAVVIGDVKCSKSVYDAIALAGGKPLMWKTGHSLIKAKMKETHSEVAGEMSGHMFFTDRWLGFDDGIYAACRMVEIVDKSKEPLSALLHDLPPLFSTPEIRVDCSDESKFEIVKRAVAEFKKSYQVVDIDGARVEFPDGWGLVRASNTQPVLVMRFEAVSQVRLDEIRSLVETTIRKITESL
ncbi:MAG: phosphomannomutase/phosphoglucomutase [Candidatus Omnitrophica bacterium]|nr:phosphomannomutase/phosphoglucomutase [Candidatus Omnitrophota bacterium]